MAVYNLKEFAALCKMTTGNLSNIIKRGKVIVKNNTIDDSIADNRDFLQKRKDYPDKELKVEKVLTVEKVIKTPNSSSKDSEGEINNYQLDRKLKAQDLKKREAETRLLNLKEEKIRGEHIPTELVRSLIIHLSQSFVTGFKNGLEDFITVVAKAKGMNVNEIAEARGELTRVINNTVNKSVESAKKSVDSIVSEYAEKRSAGEKE